MPDNSIFLAGEKGPGSDKEILDRYHLASDASLGLLATNRDHNKEELWKAAEDPAAWLSWSCSLTARHWPRSIPPPQREAQNPQRRGAVNDFFKAMWSVLVVRYGAA